MNYRGPNEEDKFDDNKLLKGLLPLVQEFKGLLLAWSMRFISLWTAFYDEFLTITASILARVFAHEQQRWCKGLRISTGEAGVAKDSILHLILMADADQRTEEPTFAANLELLVMQRIKEEPLKTLTWLNPCVTVCTQGGKYIKAIGIKSRVLEQTHHFTHHEMLEMLKQIVDAPGLKTTSMWFAKDESTNYQDLKKRNEKTEQVRERKFPLQLFTDEVLAAIVQAFGGFEPIFQTTIHILHSKEEKGISPWSSVCPRN